MEANQIKVTDEALRRAASEGMDAFLRVFTDAYYQAMGGALTAEAMPLLNASQHTLLAYIILRDELMEGGFCQLIQNGWGPYIFHNPVARALRDWGLDELAKVLYAARKVYDAHREDLERERTDGEFLAQRFPFDSSAGARNFLDRVITLLSPTDDWSGSVTLQKAKQPVQFVHVHLSDVHGTKNQDVHSLASKVNQIYKECSSTAPIESFVQTPTRSHAFSRAQQDSASTTADVLGAQTSGTNESQVEEHVPVTIHKRPGQKASEVFVADWPSPTAEALGVDHLPTPSPIEESVPVPSVKNE